MTRIVRRTTARAASIALAAALAMLPLAACSGGEEDTAAVDAERTAELERLEQQQQELGSLREELTALQARLAAAEGGEAEEGDDPTAIRAEIERKDAELTEKVTALNEALATFINADPPVQGEPVPPATARALELKADEDVALAQEYITKGGDYARAISIYDDILGYSPDNPAVLEAKAEAERLRYMDRERFDQIEKGMTAGEVEQVLGPANPRNRRQFDDVGRAAWYYPKSPAGDAAGVLFRERNGRMEVYDTKWDAVPARAAGEAEEG